MMGLFQFQIFIFLKLFCHQKRDLTVFFFPFHLGVTPFHLQKSVEKGEARMNDLCVIAKARQNEIKPPPPTQKWTHTHTN